MRVTIALSGAAAWAFDRIEVHGTSMSPTFEPGDRLLVVRRYRPLRLGDLVSLEDPREPGRLLVKRVVALHAGGVEVAGDNASGSTDSRAFGAVPLRTVRHLVLRRYARTAAA